MEMSTDPTDYRVVRELYGPRDYFFYFSNSRTVVVVVVYSSVCLFVTDVLCLDGARYGLGCY